MGWYVSEGRIPVRWLGPAAVVVVPRELDVSNAAAVREQLLLVLNNGASVLVVDMTACTFCDCAGASAVIRAYRRASGTGAELRLAGGGPLVQRLFGLIGVDRLIEVYPAVEAALSGRSAGREQAGRAHTCQVPNDGG